MTMAVLFAIVATLMLAGAGAEGAVNTSLVEQYITVLMDDEVVPLPNPSDSPFFGMLYMTITPGPARRLSWVLWHTIDFATKATVRGPANETGTGSLLFNLAPGPASASSSKNCPITGEIPISDTLLEVFRNGEAYAEVSSGGQPLGAIRGHIRPRDNTYMALSGAVFNITDPSGNTTMGNTTGMAVFHTANVGQDPANPFSQVGINFWIISRRGGGDIFVGTDRATGDIRITFGQPTLLLPNMASLFDTEFSAFSRVGLIVGSFFVPTPLFGPGSSSLLLEVQSSGENLLLGEFVRIPNPLRPEFAFGASGIDPNAPGDSSANAPAPSLALVALAVLAARLVI